jgi:hypothetical protein
MPPFMRSSLLVDLESFGLFVPSLSYSIMYKIKILHHCSSLFAFALQSLSAVQVQSIGIGNSNICVL